MHRPYFLFYIFIIFLILPSVSAQVSDFVVVNSGDWRDVYLGLVYAELNNQDSRFLMSERHSDWIPNFIDISQQIMLIESETNPFVINYKNVLEDMGYEVKEYASEDITKTNLYLAELLKEKGISKYIIIDDAYGYNAVSVASYAVLTESFVLFADEANIRSIARFLEKTSPESILLYGQIDEEVIEALEGYSTETIDKGNRFADNLEIAKKFIEISGTKQVLLTNGQFIESEVISGGDGKEAVIFIGQEEPPEQVIEFLKTADLETGVLVGNEYFDVSRKIRERTGLNVFVKFAQSSATGGEFQKVEGLDRLYLPSLELELSVKEVSYNTKTKQLEIIYENEGNVVMYAKADIGVYAGNKRIRALGDETAFAVDEGTSKGQGYTVELSDQIRSNEELEASYFIRFGESEGSLEMTLEGKFPISVISKEDVCKVRVNKVSFDKSIQRFFIEVQNRVDETCYVKPGLHDVMVSDEEIGLEYPRIGMLEANETQVFRIKQRLDEVDIEDNRIITAYAIYGSREEFLVNMVEEDFDLEVIEETAAQKIVKFAKVSLPYIMAIIILAGIAVYFTRKKR